MKKSISLILTFVMVFATFTFLPVSAADEDGSSWETAIVINTAEEFKTISTTEAKYYKLGTSLEFSNIESGIISNFIGFLDGNGYTLTIAAKSSAAAVFTTLGGTKDNYAEIKNLNIVAKKLISNYHTGNWGRRGTLCQDAGFVNVDNVDIDTEMVVQAGVSGSNGSKGLNLGGFIGRVKKEAIVNFTNCSLSGSVTAKYQNGIDNDTNVNNVGGFVGGFEGVGQVNFTKCVNRATISYTSGADKPKAYIGQFIGAVRSNATAKFYNCYSLGKCTLTSAETSLSGSICGSIASKDGHSVYIENAAYDKSVGADEAYNTTGDSVNVTEYNSKIRYLGYQRVEDSNETDSIRLIAVIDKTEGYKDISFEITKNDKTSATLITTTVYSSITVGTSQEVTTAQKLGGQYIAAVVINGVPKTAEFSVVASITETVSES